MKPPLVRHVELRPRWSMQFLCCKLRVLPVQFLGLRSVIGLSPNVTDTPLRSGVPAALTECPDHARMLNQEWRLTRPADAFLEQH
jgi:hypothetical protein